MQIGKEVKLLLLANDMILYTEDPKDATRKLLELIKEFSKVAGDNINTQKSVVFLYTKNKRSKEDVSLHQINNPIYHHIKINKIPRDSPT